MKLFLGDCIEVLKNIPDNSIDMVLTDPPYGITANDWDNNINSDVLWKELKRIVSPQGSVILFASGKFEANIISDWKSVYKYKWTWIKQKKGFFVHAKNRPLTQHEDILVFSEYSMGHKSTLGKSRMRYFPAVTSNCYKRKINSSSKFGTTMGKRPSQKIGYIQKKTGYPSDVIDFDFLPGERGFHPSQKPVKLLEFLIQSYTMPDMTVLDFAMGSGSTGVACIHTHRKFVGIEIDPKYFKIAKQRIGELYDKRYTF